MASDQPWLAAPEGGPSDDRQVFRREGEYWTIIFDGVACRIRDIRGLPHRAVLLTHPHQPIAGLALEREAYDALGDMHGGAVAMHDSRERARINGSCGDCRCIANEKGVVLMDCPAKEPRRNTLASK